MIRYERVLVPVAALVKRVAYWSLVLALLLTVFPLFLFSCAVFGVVALCYAGLREMTS